MANEPGGGSFRLRWLELASLRVLGGCGASGSGA